MKLAYILPLAALLSALPGCATSGAEDAPRASSAPDWHEIATPTDRARVRNWRTAWIQAIAKVEASGHGPQLASEGALLQPDAAVNWDNPPAGDYRCRVLKLGAKSAGLLDYVTYPAFDCRIRMENGLMSFAKLTGSQRPLGLFLPDAGNRMVFLGTLQLGDERRALQYGRDRERDMAGIVERTGDRQWRLVLPYPHFESTIDILELVPKGAAS